jgi:hypothetical protein
MKIASRWAIAGLGLVAVWFSIPLGLTAYVNSKYGPEIRAGHISIVPLPAKLPWGLDCARLRNVQIANKQWYVDGYTATISGTVNSAVACYRTKTIHADGGKLNVVLDKSSGNKSASGTGPHGFYITAKNIELHLASGNISVDAFNASLSSQTICADKVIASHPKADAVIFNTCIYTKEKYAKAYKGSIAPKLEVKGHKIEEISFTGLSRISRSEFSVGTIKYEENIATGVHAEIKDGLVSIDIGYFSASHRRLFTSPLGVRKINISNISKDDPLSSNITIGIDDKVTVLVDVENRRVSGKDTCNNWLGVVPEELKSGPIGQMSVKGNFGFDIKLEKPISLKINSTCSIDGPTPQFITELGKPFKYTAYHPDGTPFERTAGPGTNDWIPLDFVDNMATALTITEDPGFWHHRGIIPQALENSLKDDMRLGKFFRGGSTITMQLAKNLWLNRTRTLGRKLQEGILTIALESCLSKEKILELYLNVVEFGPNIYGIGPGCAKFLKKYPGEINISEALYMATRLPSPNKAHSYEANKGFINKLIAIGVASGKISEEELANELQAEQAKEAESENEEDD